jgi:hypothetical protein
MDITAIKYILITMIVFAQVIHVYLIMNALKIKNSIVEVTRDEYIKKNHPDQSQTTMSR